MNVFLSELQEKEVISISTGLNYGRIVDVQLDSIGNITYFVVVNKKLFRKISDASEKKFKYSDIEKIGKDVILIKV